MALTSGRKGDIMAQRSAERKEVCSNDPVRQPQPRISRRVLGYGCCGPCSAM